MGARKWFPLYCLLVFGGAPAFSQVFGTVRGVVVDAQQGAVPDAAVTLKAQASAWTQEGKTNAAGEFTMAAVPAGEYAVEIEHPGFAKITRVINLSIGSAPVLHFSMDVEAVSSSIDVTAAAETVTSADESSPPVTVTGLDILQTPGADRTSSLAFITDYAPGAYMLHDHLHIRGGHEVSWLVDGVPIPNTNISSNVGRQMDPKDIESVEVSRGGYSARYGDRTYGVVNIVTRSGFEFDNDGELVLSYGNLHQSNDQVSFGGHGKKFAYYTSVSANRTDLGLEPPTEQVIHNLGSGISGFTSMTYNAGPNDQFRVNASVRQDHFQIPNTVEDQAIGIRDVDQERDSFVNTSWVHTINAGALLTVSPFYHYNQSQYNGGANDPLITTDHSTSNYAGAQVILGLVHGQHNFQAGLYGFVQNDRTLFGLTSGANAASERESVTGGVGTVFLDEQYKPFSWLTLNGGVRMTHFSGLVNENAATPRIGGALQIPRLKWVVRAYYGRYYGPPPLSTISGPLLNFVQSDQPNALFAFKSLHGERDQQKEYGVTIPFRGWVADFDHFRTDASNFADHAVLGNSNITLPLSIAYVRVRGWEATVRSPQVWHRARMHLAYSNQVVKGQGSVTGGLLDFAPPSEGFFYIDHDQRHTVTVGGEMGIPWHAYLSANVNYGSGFLDVNGPAHLPPHTSGDFAVGKSFGEGSRWTVTLTGLNLSNSRYLLGRDSAFAGTHYNNPREVIMQVRYKFHF